MLAISRFKFHQPVSQALGSEDGPLPAPSTWASRFLQEQRAGGCTPVGVGGGGHHAEVEGLTHLQPTWPLLSGSIWLHISLGNEDF